MMNLQEEFKKFMDNPGDIKPVTLNEKIHREISSELKWFPVYLITKIIFIHSLTAFLTLAICPQFGLTPFSGSFGLMEFFMRYGQFACASVCGGIFLGMSALAISLTLKRGDFIYLLHHRYGIYSGLSLVSLFVLVLTGKAINPSFIVSVEFGLFWLLAAIFFALVFTQIGKYLRYFRAN